MGEMRRILWEIDASLLLPKEPHKPNTPKKSKDKSKRGPWIKIIYNTPPKPLWQFILSLICLDL
jgi:hypothetical protein